MGLLDIFKAKWSSGDMAQDDRKKLFWYLKRKTSYTAWKRGADAFDVFASIFKKQVVEQPHAPGPVFGPFEWGDFYSQILKTQVLYEQGLSRLKIGDRSVLRYNERGALREAFVNANSWYAELIYGGERGDHEYYGKYLEEMKEAIAYFDKAQSDAGYIQPMIADAPAGIFWGEWIQCVLNNELYPRATEPGFLRRKYSSSIMYPNPLLEVPVPDEAVLIKTGDIVAENGIYEPQVKDGCMNYLLKDTLAPKLAYAGDESRAVVWSLLWKDCRYANGEIPVEERIYFPEEQDTACPSMSIEPGVVSSTSGELCPESGIWAVLDDLNLRSKFTKGHKMPKINERDVIWVWVSK